MKLSWHKRHAMREQAKSVFIYLMLVCMTISILLNVLGSLGKLSLPSLFAKEIAKEMPGFEKETIRDTQIEYVEKEVPYYFDNEGNRWEEFIITGYSANDPTYPQGTNNIVASGFDVDRQRVSRIPIAASNCVPLYSIVEIDGWGAVIILDRGLGYKTDYGWEDERWIDILFPTKQEALNFGKQKMKVRVLND